MSMEWVCPCTICDSREVCKYKDGTELFMNEKDLSGPLVQVPNNLTIDVRCKYYRRQIFTHRGEK